MSQKNFKVFLNGLGIHQPIMGYEGIFFFFFGGDIKIVELKTYTKNKTKTTKAHSIDREHRVAEFLFLEPPD